MGEDSPEKIRELNQKRLEHLDKTFEQRVKLDQMNPQRDFDNIKPSDSLKNYSPHLYSMIGGGN